MIFFRQVTSVFWKDNELNMVDTPGHADFGGEVCDCSLIKKGLIFRLLLILMFCFSRAAWILKKYSRNCMIVGKCGLLYIYIPRIKLLAGI